MADVASAMPICLPISPNTASMLVWPNVASSMTLMVPTLLGMLFARITGLVPASQAETNDWNSDSALAVVPFLPYHLLTEKRSFVR